MNQMHRRAVIAILFIALVVLGIYTFTQEQEVEEKTRNVDTLEVTELFDIDAETVSYFEESNGYLAKPAIDGDYPGVVMIHEWWGLNDNIKRMADKLASQGYVVLAVDLYNGEVAEEPDQARELATSVRSNPEGAIENMQAAVTYLREEQNASRIASLGWCFGGQQSLQISLNEEVDATVIYYGNLVTDPEELAVIDHPVLGIFGSEDTSIPVETVNEFDVALDELGIENEIHIYDGVGHAFANPSGDNYAPEETEDAYMKTLDFLDRNLK